MAELSRPTLAAPLMLSELPDTAPVDDSVADGAGGKWRPRRPRPSSVQFTSLHSSWSQPTLPCAVSPSSVAEPVRASEQVRDRLSLEGAGPDLRAVQVQRARRLLHQPGDRPPPKAPKCSFAIPPGGAEKSRRAVLHTPCKAVPRKVPVTPTQSLSAALTYITKLEAVPSLRRQPKG